MRLACAPLRGRPSSPSGPGVWLPSAKPGSSSSLLRFLFHSFQLTSCTLRRREDTCSNYRPSCDASLSCQRRRIREEHGALSINRSARTTASLGQSSNPTLLSATITVIIHTVCLRIGLKRRNRFVKRGFTARVLKAET